MDMVEIIIILIFADHNRNFRGILNGMAAHEE